MRRVNFTPHACAIVSGGFSLARKINDSDRSLVRSAAEKPPFREITGHHSAPLCVCVPTCLCVFHAIC